MEKEDRKHDVYGPENLIRYHTALSFVDRLGARAFCDLRIGLKSIQ